MAEIVGVVASAVSLAQACRSVINTINDMKSSRSTLNGYLMHLQSLQSISTEISETSLLQTPEIEAQIIALLLTINSLLVSLKGKRHLPLAIFFLCKEAAIISILADVERQKSNLSLAIQNVQSKALNVIQNDISAIGPPRNQPIYPRHVSSTTTTDDQCTSFPGQSNDSTRTCSMGTYNNPFAGSGFDQMNGVMFSGSGPLLKELTRNEKNEWHAQPIIYDHPYKVGRGKQLNGAEIELEGDITDATLPDLSRLRFLNPQAVSSSSSGPGGKCGGTQFNGIVVRQKR